MHKKYLAMQDYVASNAYCPLSPNHPPVINFKTFLKKIWKHKTQSPARNQPGLTFDIVHSDAAYRFFTLHNERWQQWWFSIFKMDSK